MVTFDAVSLVDNAFHAALQDHPVVQRLLLLDAEAAGRMRVARELLVVAAESVARQLGEDEAAAVARETAAKVVEQVEEGLRLADYEESLRR